MADFFHKRSKPALLALGLFAMALVGLGDSLATTQLLEFSVFFLLPVAFFTWFVSRRAGLLASLGSGVIIAGVNSSSPTYVLHGQIAYWNAVVWTVFFVLITFIIADMKGLHIRERELARIDSLTRAATRAAFFEFAADEINRARRSSQPMTLAYLDLDRFKEINDRNGHATGDSVLAAVARGIQNHIRRTDMVARLGGDEFALFLPNTCKEAATKLLGKVLEALANTMRHQGWPVTFSVGAVTFLNAPESVQAMVQRTDEVMYSVKRNGKNRMCLEIAA
ncbi:MAG TPA: GGDEF domain-containing protein [Candidatus Binatia bacterium]|nr:GGDEF domain-containing protein [Candidatus Binatia bacterium]